MYALCQVVYCRCESMYFLRWLTQKMQGEAECAPGPDTGQGGDCLYCVGKRF